MTLTIQEAILRRAQDLSEIGFDIADVTREKRHMRRSIRLLTNSRDQVLRALNRKTGGTPEECRKPYARKLQDEIKRVECRIDTFRSQLDMLNEDASALLALGGV